MIDKVINHVGVLAKGKSIVKWSDGKYTAKNIGDVLNPYLFKKVFQRDIVSYKKVVNLGIPVVYSFIGSVLDNSAVKNLIVMGSGFKRESSIMVVKPKKVVSCRGPLTRDKLLRLGVEEVPEVYGDPAILLPHYYNPEVEKKYIMGFIPHYVDKNLNIVKVWSGKKDVKYIDVFSKMETFISNVKSCEFTVSSSLHGVILSHAYGIPSVWAPLSDNLAGGGFKFNDYYQSINADCTPIHLEKYKTPLEVEKNTSLPHLGDITEGLFEAFKSFKI